MAIAGFELFISLKWGEIMRWFKHMTCSNRDEALMILRDEMGLEGYGAYWLVLEFIGEKLSEKNEAFLKFSFKNWKNFVGFPKKKFEKFLEICEKNELFFVKLEDDFLTIGCPKLLNYRDEHTKKLAKKNEENSGATPEQLRSKSGVTPEQLRTEQKRIDKNKINKILQIRRVQDVCRSGGACAQGRAAPDLAPTKKLQELKGDEMIEAKKLQNKKDVLQDKLQDKSLETAEETEKMVEVKELPKDEQKEKKPDRIYRNTRVNALDDDEFDELRELQQMLNKRNDAWKGKYDDAKED